MFGSFASRFPHVALAILGLTSHVIATVGTAAAADRHAAFVIDANTGQVLRGEQADERRFPASLTKMMTLYLAFEGIERGRWNYSTRIKISQEAASQPPTKLDLDPGETIQLIDAMKSLITKSANDMAVAIAEHIGGSEHRFSQMMTEKARLIGMGNTTFRNASGLPDPDQTTTARDMVTLALRLQDDFPTHYQLFSIKSFSYGRSSYRNHNNLLFNFQGTEGIKTGYTRASGFNLVASVKRGSRHVIGAVFGGASSSRRDDAMRLMLSQALIKASPTKTRRPAPVLVAQTRPAERTVARTDARTEQRTVAVASPALIAPPVAAARPKPRGDTISVTDVREVVRAENVAQPTASQRSAEIPPLQSVPVRIDVARVKPVMVPLRARSPEPPPPTPSPRPSVDANAQPAPQPILTHVALAPPTEPVVARPPARAITQQPAEPMRGTAPSTFGQQAANLARGGQPVASAPSPSPSPPASNVTNVKFAQAGASPQFNLRGPQAPPVLTPPTASGFEVQIGAFATSAEADRALTSARASAGDLLNAHPGRAILVQKESRQLYRARLTGFDSKTAAATCIELRRRQVDCFVMKAE